MADVRMHLSPMEEQRNFQKVICNGIDWTTLQSKSPLQALASLLSVHDASVSWQIIGHSLSKNGWKVSGFSCCPRCNAVRLEMSDEEIAQKLASLKKGGRRRPGGRPRGNALPVAAGTPGPVPRVNALPVAAGTPREQTDLSSQLVTASTKPSAPSEPSLVLSSLDSVLPSTLDAPVWTVPEELRNPGAPPCTEYGHHVSLESIFPGTGLAEAWDTCSSLRTKVRQALRDDLFAPLLRKQNKSEKQLAVLLSLETGCMISWDMALRAHAEGKVTLDRFTEAFKEHGITDLDGTTFLRKLGALCGRTPHGSLIDIIPLDRAVPHSWHQDTGIPQNTVLLGFPPRDGYVGGGVFSNFVKLSHPLRPSAGDEHGAVVEFERLSDPPPAPIPDEYVFRPIYRKGQEVWVSNDASYVHSTPDRQLRECLWRFM